MMRGAFITLEGIEGAGKSTVVQWLGQWLRERGLAVVGEPDVADEQRGAGAQGASPSARAICSALNRIMPR